MVQMLEDVAVWAAGRLQTSTAELESYDSSLLEGKQTHLDLIGSGSFSSSSQEEMVCVLWELIAAL